MKKKIDKYEMSNSCFKFLSVLGFEKKKLFFNISSKKSLHIVLTILT